MDNIFVTMPPWHPVTSGASPPAVGKGDKDKAAKNPVSHWRISKRSVVGKVFVFPPEMTPLTGLSDFVYSPDVKFVAAISEDGCLRVIDALQEQQVFSSTSLVLLLTCIVIRLVDCYASYFGALSCVAWSPDGRFIVVRMILPSFRCSKLMQTSDWRTGRSANHLLALGTTGRRPVPRPFLLRDIRSFRRPTVGRQDISSRQRRRGQQTHSMGLLQRGFASTETPSHTSPPHVHVVKSIVGEQTRSICTQPVRRVFWI